MGELWHLPPELEFSHGIDSWTVRERPCYDAPISGVLSAGQQFRVVSSEGDWLKLAGGQAPLGWTCRRLQPQHGGVEVLVPLLGGPSVLASRCQTANPDLEPTVLQTQKSSKDSVFELLEQLRVRRHELGMLNGTTGLDRFRAESVVQDTMQKLELFGISQELLLARDGADGLEAKCIFEAFLCSRMERHESYPHSDFANPRAESCWLSTLFQSLWHSRVFHSIFETIIKPLPFAGRGNALGALQETWELYERAAVDRRTVSVAALVQAWGRGYGDCAEAFGKLQGDTALQPLADLFALVPVPWTGEVPTLSGLWDLVLQMGVGHIPLVALEMSFPPLSRSSMQKLALALAPMEETEPSPSPTMRDADLGTGFRLVAMICFVEEFAHYVVFCRGISDSGTWHFFNDLPGTGSSNAYHRFVGWWQVGDACARYQSCPKMLLYENKTAAAVFLKEKAEKICPWIVESVKEKKSCFQM